MIYSPGHGDTAFTVPLFDPFMRRIMSIDDIPPMSSPPPVSGNADPLNQISALVQGFRENLPALKDAGTLEAVVRQEYIDPFWTALGWDVANTAHLPPDQKEVIIEAPGGTVEGNSLSLTLI